MTPWHLASSTLDIRYKVVIRAREKRLCFLSKSKINNGSKFDSWGDWLIAVWHYDLQPDSLFKVWLYICSALYSRVSKVYWKLFYPGADMELFLPCPIWMFCGPPFSPVARRSVRLVRLSLPTLHVEPTAAQVKKPRWSSRRGRHERATPLTQSKVLRELQKRASLQGFRLKSCSIVT